jgi:putative intracellular protease/amidase/tRNA A-37 threonylcarbamoyl transferase component Bud32
MPVSLEEFREQLSSSGILPLGELQAVETEIAAGDTESLARELVKRGKLTKFQAAMLFQGKGGNLVLGNYVLLDKLGQGGMGVVFKAQHRRMDRIVALKVLPPAATRSPDLLRRFQREAQAAARLLHPNIVAAYDADEAAGTHFLVMEYVSGIDLASLVRRDGPLGVGRAVDCILQAARGLEYAHGEGVVHRDIKPGNLLLSDKGVVKILDMGLARLEASPLHAAPDEITRTGSVMGTIDYMAPEQAEDMKQADARSDIYSLGCTLFFLLTGRTLFEGDTIVRKIVAHREQAAPSLGDHVADVPPALEAVFRRMVAKRPQERFGSMSELIFALDTCGTALSGGGGGAWDELLETLHGQPSPASAKPATRASSGTVVSGGAAAPSADAETSALEAHQPTLGFVPAGAGAAMAAGRRRWKLPRLRRKTWIAISIAAVLLPALSVALVQLIPAIRTWTVSGGPGDRPTRGSKGGGRTDNGSSPVVDPPTPEIRNPPSRFVPGQIEPAPPMPLSGGDPPHVLFVIAHDGYYHLDYLNVMKSLESRAEVVVASTEIGEAIPWNVAPVPPQPATADMLVAEAKPEDFDTIIVCGGKVAEYEGASQNAQTLRTLILAMHGQKKPVASICTGGVVLAQAGLLRGQEAVCWPQRRAELEAEGATFVDQEVVVAGRVVTGRDPQAASALVTEVLRLTGSTSKVPEERRRQWPRRRKGRAPEGSLRGRPE